jgi:hypothetical protein
MNWGQLTMPLGWWRVCSANPVRGAFARGLFRRLDHLQESFPMRRKLRQCTGVRCRCRTHRASSARGAMRWRCNGRVRMRAVVFRSFGALLRSNAESLDLVLGSKTWGAEWNGASAWGYVVLVVRASNSHATASTKAPDGGQAPFCSWGRQNAAVLNQSPPPGHQPHSPQPVMWLVLHFLTQAPPTMTR